MENLDVLKLAVEVMKAHNETCGYKTFTDISLDESDEVIKFDIKSIFASAAYQVADLLNLNFSFDINTDPSDNRKFNYFIR